MSYNRPLNLQGRSGRGGSVTVFRRSHFHPDPSVQCESYGPQGGGLVMMRMMMGQPQFFMRERRSSGSGGQGSVQAQSLAQGGGSAHKDIVCRHPHTK